MKVKNEPVDQWLERVGEWMTSMGWMGEKETAKK